MSKKSKKEPARHYKPSATMTEKLQANREGKLTSGQRSPIIIAALLASVALICPASIFIGLLAGLLTGAEFIVTGGILGWVLLCGMYTSIFVLGVVLWVNARMFLPEMFMDSPVRWERGPLEIKMASRERPEMPFSYIIGSYSFAPFVQPNEVPMQIGREYIVYYTKRSRLLLSIAPLDQKESENWLPVQETT